MNGEMVNDESVNGEVVNCELRDCNDNANCQMRTAHRQLQTAYSPLSAFKI